jgi:hypothetical protein
LVHGTEELGLAVCPRAITCTAEDGCDPITVTSTGSSPVRNFWLEFEDDADAYLTATGCDNAVLAKGEKCTITLAFFPERASEEATTHLVIHQNLPEVPTLVPLKATGTVPVEPDLALGAATCDPSGLSEAVNLGTVSGELLVEAPLSATGLAGLPSAWAAVFVDGLLWQTVEVDPNGGLVSVRAFYDGPRPAQVVVRIDPDGAVEQAPAGDEATAAC